MKNMRGSRVVVVGSVAVDLVVHTDMFPKPGNWTFATKAFRNVVGGKGLNKAIAASRLGNNVSFVASIGNDPPGEQVLEFLKKEGMKTNEIRLSRNEPTMRVVAIINKKGENVLISFPKYDHKLSVADIKELKFDGSEVVVSELAMRENVIVELFKRAQKAGCTTVLDLAPITKCSAKTLSLPDYCIANRQELAFHTNNTPVDGSNIDQVIELARKLRKRKGQIIISTLGERGLVCVKEEEAIRINSHRVKTRDTTGAGDCFVGSFAAALAEGKELNEALEFANIAAAISVQYEGATTSFPKLADVEKFKRRVNG